MTTTCAICGMPFEARTTYGICPLCYHRDTLREFDRLESEKRRAIRAKLPATLTLVEWLSVVSDFNALCAYCLVTPFSAIDTVVPLTGLTRENVVPACRSCVVHKRQGFDQATQRVKSYLAGEVRFRFDDDTLDELPAQIL